MTRAPFVMKKPELEFPRGNMELFDTTIGWQFVNPKMEKMYGTDSMPRLPRTWPSDLAFRGKSRTFAYLSQQRAKAAVESGRFGKAGQS